MAEGIQVKIIHGLSRNETIGRLVILAIIIGIVLLGSLAFVHALEWVGKPFPGFLLNQRMVVPGVGQYHWSGTQAGLNNLDRVVSVNGTPVSTFAEILAVVMQVPVGTVLEYAIEREGQLFSLSIATMAFRVGDLLVLFGIDCFIGLTDVAMGLTVFALKPDTRVSWSFLVACFILSLNHLTSFDVVAVHAGFVRLFFVGSALLPAAAIHLSLVFPETTRLVQRFPRVQWLPYVLSLALLVPLQVLYPSDLFLIAYMGVFVFLLLAAMALIGSTLATYVRKVSILAQQRAKIILWGALLAFPIPALGQLGSFAGIMIDGHPIHANLTGIPILIFPLSISYAISRHNLFDVDVYIKRAVGYGVMTLLVGLAYFSIHTVLRTFILEPLFGTSTEFIYPVIFAVLIVFFFNPAHRAVQDLVDLLFFRRQFDYKDTIASVSTALASLFDQQEIIHQLLKTIQTNMFVDTASVLVFHSGKETVSVFSRDGEPGNPGAPFRESTLTIDHPLVALLLKEKHLVTKYDVAESPRFSDVRERCGDAFSALGASLALPLLHQGDVKGMLTLGYKKTGHFYSREDIELLETLATQGAVAIENARLADQMRKEEKVRTNLARYLSPQVVDQIIDQDVQVNLGGARKVVTILFSDIRNFTSMTETRPPDQLVAILNEYFTEMASIIFANQGSLDKYIGDAIVAVFGSLIPLDNSALHAVRAASRMMEVMPSLNDRWMQKYAFGMDIGIGITTGEVFLGNIGSPERMEFTVIGDAVNVASRFSGLAKPGQILMTRGTLTKLGRAIPYQTLPSALVKGKSEKLEVFEVTTCT